MEEQMERRPLILYETIEMLYKYINGISFHDIAESMSRLYGDVFPGVFVQKLDCLERITQEVCSGLQVQNRQMQRFFRRFETDAIRDNLCLAKVMTLSFFLYDHPELEEEAEALKRHWAGMRQEGFQIVAVSMSGLEFRPLEPGQRRKDLVEQLCELDYPAMAAAVIKEYLTDYSQDFLTEAARKTYGDAFGGKAGYLAPVEGDTYALELWHGPTCAFKDYALQLMPKLLVEAKKNLGRTEKTLILVATSGDTGKAALDGYHDIPGVEIAVFYPTGGTSEIQRLQMATQEGANVAVYAVRGNFDDAQTGVKKVFGDTAIAAELAKRNIRLSSANSINWGRLVPQIVYYFAAYAQLLKAGRITFGDEVDFCVPTGNFGDILAGYYAKRMGLPVGKLVCASNENNVLTDFLTTGTYTAKREFFKTTSPSMDILVSSNLERLLYHVTGSDAEVAGLMKSLAETGSYTVRPETLAAIQENFSCGWSSEEEVAGEIRARYEQDGYLCDTHTAVAFHVAGCHKREGVPMVVLSTASPYKFPRSVLEALGRTAPENDFEAMQQLEAATAHTAPASLAALRQKPERFNTVIDPAQIAEVALGYQA